MTPETATTHLIPLTEARSRQSIRTLRSLTVPLHLSDPLFQQTIDQLNRDRITWHLTIHPRKDNRSTPKYQIWRTPAENTINCKSHQRAHVSYAGPIAKYLTGPSRR